MKLAIARFLALLVLSVPAALFAHDPGLSITDVHIEKQALTVTAGFSVADVRMLMPPADRGPARWTVNEYALLEPLLRETAADLWICRIDGVPARAAEVRPRLEVGDNVSFTVRFDRVSQAGAADLSFRGFDRLPPGHRMFVSVTDATGQGLSKEILSVGSPSIRIPLANPSEAPAPEPTFLGFLTLGIEHIWTGYDHLLFLFALLIVCRTFRSIVTIISCFTLAHSLTLAVATLGWVNLSPRIVEPAIAASIVFVGLENLWRRGAEPRGRWALTFAFGLIHGFGFASVLKDLGVGQGGSGLAMPLFTFNLGVEVGQVAVAALVLPVVWRLRRSPWFVAKAVPALSVAVALAGFYWFFERTVFSG